MPDEIVTPEVKTLVRGEAAVVKTEEKVTLKSKDGAEYDACALTLNEMIDFEEDMDVSLLEAVKEKLKLTHLAEISYLSARRSGQTKVQLLNRQYKISREEFMESFGFDFFNQGGAKYALHVLRLSGILKPNPPVQANPTAEPDKSAGTGEKLAAQ
jgi:hypothetical protein